MRDEDFVKKKWKTNNKTRHAKKKVCVCIHAHTVNSYSDDDDDEAAFWKSLTIKNVC